MALSTVLRLTASSSSSVLIHNRRLLPPFAKLTFRSSGLRFLSPSASSKRPRRCVHPVKARRKESEDEEGAEGSNGSVLLKDDAAEGRVVTAELHKEASEAYMSYAMSVLVGRALPDVRDGLKPVHRRILFAMHELGLSPRKPFKKCARVVGEVLGKFHPHGDTAVYESLVRMAQDFSLRSPLIQGHGNFGSIDADPPAAMRYTECRLQTLTEAMLLSDLDMNTVDFVPNFDNSQKEPSLLPARIPTLLLNGSSGIAVGMATNIPPHNLGELVDALSALINNPDATLQELLEYMPGPDFPTGGLIMGNLGILDAYRTGRGRIVVRGKTDVEMLDANGKRMAVIIKEIPYGTNKSLLVRKIAELVENKSIEGISDVRDESDRSGMRVVIEVKRGSSPYIVLNNLFRQTALQSSFSCNMISILDGQPKLMGLREILQAFIDFRCTVVERRERYRLFEAENRKHIFEGILVGIENLDAIIKLIKEAPSIAKASASLMEGYGLSSKQADAVLDMKISRLTSLERKKIVDEGCSLEEQITKLKELLSSKRNLLQVIEQEIIELKNKFGTPRFSAIEDSDEGQLDDLDVIPNEEMLLAFSEKGYVKRIKPDTFSLQHRGTIGKSVGKMRGEDAMSDFVVCHAHDHVLFFSDKGIVYSSRAYRVPESTRSAAGTPLVQLLSLSVGERITSVIPVSEFVDNQYLVMLTIRGYIKKVQLNLFSAIRSTGIIAIQLVSGDELKWVRRCADDDLIAIASQNGMALVNSCNMLRATGRNARGAGSMRLKSGDMMASMDIIPAAMQVDLPKNFAKTRGDLSPPWLLFVSESGHGKRVPLSHFRLSNFNRVGSVGYKPLPNQHLAAVFVVGFSLKDDGESNEQLVLVSQSGTVNRIKVRDISIQSRFARGVILMRLDHGGKIQSASLMSGTDDKEEVDV